MYWKIATGFAAALLIPTEALTYILGGFCLLFASIYSLTSTTTTAILFRLAVAPLAISLFWTFGYGQFATDEVQVAVAMAVIALYGIMRVVDTSIVSLLDEHPPLWLSMETGKALPLPSTIPQ